MENEQDGRAQYELEEDERWIRSTAVHEDKLGGLVDRVLADDAQGKCQELESGGL